MPPPTKPETCRERHELGRASLTHQSPSISCRSNSIGDRAMKKALSLATPAPCAAVPGRSDFRLFSARRAVRGQHPMSTPATSCRNCELMPTSRHHDSASKAPTLPRAGIAPRHPSHDPPQPAGPPAPQERTLRRMNSALNGTDGALLMRIPPGRVNSRVSVRGN